MYIVIMAGGSGTRFWPVSKEEYPKQYLNIISNKPLIEETFLRVKSLVKKEAHIIIVVNQIHKELTEKIFARYKVKIIVEPFGKNTAPCIGLAAIHIKKEAGNVPFIVMPADHFIADTLAFKNILRIAVFSLNENQINIIGIVPTKPETGYGYIELGEKISKIKNNILYKVKKFTEKPNIKKAQTFLKKGNYLWNAGIFAFNANTILKEIETLMPDLYKGLKEIENNINTEKYEHVLKNIYEKFEPVSIDYGVLEKTKTNIIALKGTFGWSDVGSWQSLYLLRGNEMDSCGNILDCKGLNVDCKNIFVFSRSSRLITTLGLKNTLIVDMPDTLLVADINKSQDVRKIVEEIKKRETQNLR